MQTGETIQHQFYIISYKYPLVVMKVRSQYTVQIAGSRASDKYGTRLLPEHFTYSFWENYANWTHV